MHKIPLNEFVKNSEREVNKISKPFKEETGVNFFAYIKQYDDGSFCDLISNPEWSQYFYDTYLDNIETTTKRLTPGINYWRRNSNHSISQVQEDARDNFDIDARIEFVYRDDLQGCYHIYAFSADRKTADKAYRYYDMHRGKLLKFIGHFNHKASSLIAEGDRPENRVQIAKYVAPEHSDTRRNYASELKLENASSELKDREFEVMVLYANGCTEKQIAEMLNRSPNTVSTYLQIIRDKTACHDKRDLHRYVVNNGWSGLEKFFFPYINA